MSFKSFHLANSRSLLVIMEKTPRGTGYSGLALLPPLKAWDSEVTWDSWGEAVLYSYDAANTLRKSHESPVVKALYDEYFEKPGSHKAHKILHTTYIDRSKNVIK